MPDKLVRNLRVCITEKCNLKCFFCHREWDPSSNCLLEVKDIVKIVEAASSLGIKNVKITGGEPLVRSDIVEIISRIFPLVDEVSLVTNGVLLEDYASDLKRAGLSRVNVSLPSLDSSKYESMTGGGDISRVLKGIEAAREVGLTPVKINMVILKGINENEVEKMIDYACNIGAALQLIELQPIPEGEQVFEKFYVSLRQIEESIALKSVMRTLNPTGQRTVYTIPRNGGKAVVEIVSPINNPDFCSRCSKLRVTCDGRLKPCLLRNDNLVNILETVRSEAGLEALREKFIEAISLKEPYWKISPKV